MKKPIPLRIIFILNLLLVIVCYVFYFVFKSKDIELGKVNPEKILYTAISYTVIFAALVYSILNKKLLLVRICTILTFAVSIPTSAFIGIGVSIISFALTFHPKVKSYLNS